VYDRLTDVERIILEIPKRTLAKRQVTGIASQFIARSQSKCIQKNVVDGDIKTTGKEVSCNL
jgi:hypothetical protein